jgi:hypothetical protein
MFCACQTNALVDLQKSEPPALAANQSERKYQDSNKPRTNADSKHTYPEHVWGDEGPIND